MYLPRIDDEQTTLCTYLDVQLTGLRSATLGLTDDQAKERPLRSALTLAGLVKHACFAMGGALVGAGLRDAATVDLDFQGSFQASADETLDVLLARFDELRHEYLAMCRGLDLDAEVPVGPMPWFDVHETRTATMRYLVVHHIEEFARHAGHADLIREQIDGATAAELLAAVEGHPANAWVTPWSPAE